MTRAEMEKTEGAVRPPLVMLPLLEMLLEMVAVLMPPTLVLQGGPPPTKFGTSIMTFL